MFEGLTVTDHAKTAQREAMQYLKTKGYKVIAEYEVPENNREHRGFVDIVAFKDSEKIAIEFDRHSPRRNSIFKLERMDGFRKIILLRDRGKCKLDGIEVYSIPIKEV